MVRGAVLVEERDRARGLAGSTRATSRRSQGLRLGKSLLLSFLAGACLRAARTDEGLAAVDEGLDLLPRNHRAMRRARPLAPAGRLVLRRAPARGRRSQVRNAEAMSASSTPEQWRAHRERTCSSGASAPATPAAGGSNMRRDEIAVGPLAA